MAVKKVKISNVKRTAHLKSKKKTLTKSQQQRANAKGAAKKQNIFNAPPKPSKKDLLLKRKSKYYNEPEPAEDEDDDQIVDNVMDMLDGDDLEYLEAAGANKQRKRKLADTTVDAESVGIESRYSAQNLKEKSDMKIQINLLPIKNRDGQIISRTTEVDYKPKPKIAKKDTDEKEEEDDEDDKSDYEDSDDDVLYDESVKPAPAQKLISTTDLLIHRQQEIERQKYRIGIICSGILEKPEDKMKNFNALFDLMEENNENGTPNLLTVRKVALLSITEIFKDILPEYRVGQVDTKMQTVRKATLERVTYENALLQQFKKFLQKLEKITASVTKRGGGRITPQTIKIAEVGVTCLCELLVAHPYFNYVQNIAQLLVYMLNCNFPRMREEVNKCFRTVFATDKKVDMTLYIIRRINHLIKARSNLVHLDMITCLLALKIKNVNLDAEKENELKQKKLESHRQRLLNLSKKERKRHKKLKELNKELEETKAEENKQSKHYKITEVVKMVFTIYFRILKNDPNSKALSACLEGLAEFAHVINLEYFSDLIDVLNNILETTELGYREQLHCIRTIFVILTGQGEVLNIDPIRFYGHFYRNLLAVHAGKNHEDFQIILRTLDDVLVKRRKNITQQRLLAFVKRLSTISMHLMHNGTLASLGTVKTIMQLTSMLEIILDTDTSVGSGRFDPELEDPEYCNASCTALYELTRLARHYHPTVRRVALHIANGVPATGDGSLPPEIGKLTPEEFFEKYDSSQMAFNPTIPVPRKSEPKIKKGKYNYVDVSFKSYYQSIMNEAKVLPRIQQNFDFFSNYEKGPDSFMEIDD
ncbi:nucleolar complex protein 3 homolog [Episyrphus balteatus]|uniref:nucleolar complex protein 3 homolog n=1 Tax=Episyrphus balteatus TaxID=286459 RepID=UPI0024868275|nr:nucleolar complex protein 3 homolog [Episyrphus balteatus]